MDAYRKFLHDRVILVLMTAMSVLVVIGVSIVLLRFDASKSPTTTIAYRQNVTGISYMSGKPLDIYAMAAFMVLVAIGAVIIAAKIYPVRRPVAVFILASTLFLLVLAARVSYSLINLQ